MKKKLLAMLLSALMLMTCAAAATSAQTKTADALYDLGLFKGTDTGYELDRTLSRAEGVTLLVRLIGKEAEAQKGGFALPFTDVDAWAKGYIGYAYANNITKGVSETEFNSTGTMAEYMFLTLTLRALGYSDSGENAQFSWDKPYELASDVGLVTTTTPDSNFTRGDAVAVFWKALNAELNGSEMTLSESLIEQKVFTKAQFNAAVSTQKNGRPAAPAVGGGSTGGGSSKPSGGSTTGGSTTGGAATSGPAAGITYEDYMAMSGEEQMALSEKFTDLGEFISWLGGVKDAYDAEQEKNEIIIDGDTVIDLEQIINGSK